MIQRAFLRVFFGDLLAGLLKNSYLCIVEEKDGFGAMPREIIFSGAQEIFSSRGRKKDAWKSARETISKTIY